MAITTAHVITVRPQCMMVNMSVSFEEELVATLIMAETEKEFSLTDKMIETLYNDPTILISHTHPHTPDILVKEYSSFASLSFHTLKKSLLDEQYIPSNKDKYMIM